VLPKSYVPLGFALPKSELLFNKGNAPVYVSQMYSPSKLYMQFKINKSSLNNMMDQLQLTLTFNFKNFD